MAATHAPHRVAGNLGEERQRHKGRGMVRFNRETMRVESESSSEEALKCPALEAALIEVERRLGNERMLEEELYHVQLHGGSARKCSIAERQDSVPLNRYWDSLPFDYNRIVLHRHLESDTGYINASHIVSPEDERPDWNFIIAQGPLSHTVCDFWEMIYKMDTSLIVMLTGLVETDPKGELKDMCSCYWPGELHTTTIHGPIQVTQLSRKFIGDDIIERTFRLWSAYDEQERPLVQYQYRGWNESLVDANMVPLRRLLSIALDSGYVSEKSKQPIVVHCDSGITRSASFVFTAVALQKLAGLEPEDVEGAKAAVDIQTNLLALRKLRPNAIPRLQLLKLICKVLREEIRAMLLFK